MLLNHALLGTHTSLAVVNPYTVGNSHVTGYHKSCTTENSHVTGCHKSCTTENSHVTGCHKSCTTGYSHNTGCCELCTPDGFRGKPSHRQAGTFGRRTCSRERVLRHFHGDATADKNVSCTQVAVNNVLM